MTNFENLVERAENLAPDLATRMTIRKIADRVMELFGQPGEEDEKNAIRSFKERCDDASIEY
jgi:hypothetical protein